MFSSSKIDQPVAGALLPPDLDQTIFSQIEGLKLPSTRHEAVGQSFQHQSDYSDSVETSLQNTIFATSNHLYSDRASAASSEDWLIGKSSPQALSDPAAIQDPLTGETLAEIPTTHTLQNPISAGEGSDPNGDGIFGKDNRERVDNTTAFPFSSIVRISSTWAGADNRLGTSDDIETTASGALVSNFHVLTAGHVIHEKRYGGWADSIEVIAGSKGKQIPGTSRANYEYYGRAKATYKRSYTKWTSDRNFDYDIGLITLDRNLGSHTGVFAYGPPSATSDRKLTRANAAGYPSDIFDADRNGTWDNYDMTTQYGKVTTTPLTYQSTDLDLVGGNSGGPLWKYNASTKQRTIYGVASNSTKSRTTGAGLYNEFTAITWSRAQDLRRWMNADYAARQPNDQPDLVDYDNWFNTNLAYFRNHTTGSNLTVRAGDSFTTRSVVRNNGTTAYNGSSKGFFLVTPSIKVSFYASTNNVIDGGDHKIGETFLSAINPFSWKDATWTGKFPALTKGRYFVGWKIDDGDIYNEFNNNNNTGLLKQRITVV